MQAAIQISQYGVKQAWVGAGLVPGASKPVPSPAAAITAEKVHVQNVLQTKLREGNQKFQSRFFLDFVLSRFLGVS
jgi:hypothetical protein